MRDAAKSDRTNGRAGAVGLVLALVVGVEVGRLTVGAGPMAAQAVAGEPTGTVNPADQRNQIIAELRKLNERMSTVGDTVKAALAGGPIDVSVVEFPKGMTVQSE